MPERLSIFLVLLVVAVSGCKTPPAEESSPARTRGSSDVTTIHQASRSVPPWYANIERVPPAASRSAIDPETGEPIWTDFADADFPRPLSRDQAFSILLNTETFADPYVGYAVAKSAQVEAFQILLDRPDAAAAFADLSRRAYTAGRLYALCGLYLVDRASYARLEKALAATPTTVRTHSFCIVDERPVREVICSSDPNTVRLSGGETIEQWFARAKPPGDAAMFDIAGGAVPTAMREAR